jgi:hypothetical protein
MPWRVDALPGFSRAARPDDLRRRGQEELVELDAVKCGQAYGSLERHVHATLLDAGVVLCVHLEALRGSLLRHFPSTPELADPQTEVPLGPLKRSGLPHAETVGAPVRRKQSLKRLSAALGSRALAKRPPSDEDDSASEAGVDRLFEV